MMMFPRQQHPTVEVPPWDPPYDDQTTLYSPPTNDYFSALHRYLPSREPEFDDSDTDSLGGCGDFPFDSFSCDSFRMYEFKVRRCARGRSHDWTECPYAHPGEKARRRDPRKYHYSGVPCPDFRRGACRRGDDCEFAHGVFECWLHPARYRTQPCKDGAHCKRRVCFFAHSLEQLRVLPPHESPSSPLGRLVVDSFKGLISPVSVQECPDSPPMSPNYNSVGELGGNSMGELINSMRGLRMGSLGNGGGRSSQMECGTGSVFGCGFGGAASLPGTPTRAPTHSGLGLSDPWDLSTEEEVPMERVESGKDLRARIYAKLSKENSLDGGWADSVSSGPDFGWVSELVK